MTDFILCFLSIFSVLGIFFLSREIISGILKSHNKNPLIVIGVKNHEDSIEGIVRTIMKSHPLSEILIIDYGSSDHTAEIIQKLAKDYSKIHINY